MIPWFQVTNDSSTFFIKHAGRHVSEQPLLTASSSNSTRDRIISSIFHNSSGGAVAFGIALSIICSDDSYKTSGFTQTAKDIY
jgi:hypothetical protein